MKTAIALTMIIVGGLLVVAPIASDLLQRQQVVTAMGRPGVTSVSLQPELSTTYRLGCWLTGTGAITAAIFLSRRSGKPPEEF